MSDGELPTPVLRWIQRESRGPGIDCASLDFPAMLVRFAAVKSGDFYAHDFVGQTQRHYVVGNVRGILEVVTERRQRVFAGGDAVGKRFGTDRRIADRRRVE